jgi:hypothetical protein
MLLTGVELGHEGPVVVKRGSGAPGVEALRREGDRLHRAGHPGVVRVVRSGPTADGWELVLTHGGRPLSSAGPMSPRSAAAITASVASTVADLHELDIVHGRLDPSHVLVGEHGQPLLCGFGDGSAGGTRADDVAAIGRLLTTLLGPGAEPELMPERRWRRSRPAWERKALLAVADLALAEPSERRPSARRLAAAISAAVPDRATPAVEAARGVDPIERLRPAHAAPAERPPRRATLALGLCLTVVGVASVVIGVAGLRGGAPAAPPPLGAAADVTATAAPVPGSVLVADGHRYRVGAPGDHVLVGDWWCDGTPTPALLRPSTHEVFVFERWAADEPLAVRPTTRVRGATTLVRQDGDGGCPVLAAVAGDDLVPIDLGGAP